MGKFREKWVCERPRSKGYSLCRTIKSSYDAEKHLYVIDKRIFRDVHIVFRFGMTDTYIHTDRFGSEQQLLCPLCKEEDEHVLVRCQALPGIRKKYLFLHIKPNNECVIRQLCTSYEIIIIRAICTCLHQAMKKRSKHRTHGRR